MFRLDKLTQKAQEALQVSQTLAEENGNQIMFPLHLLTALSGDGRTAFGYPANEKYAVPISLGEDHAMRELGARGDLQSIAFVSAASYNGSAILIGKASAGHAAYWLNGVALTPELLPLRLSDDGQHVLGLRDSGDGGAILANIMPNQPDRIMARLNQATLASIMAGSLSQDLRRLVLLQNSRGTKNLVLLRDGRQEVIEVAGIEGVTGDACSLLAPPDLSSIVLATTGGACSDLVKTYYLLIAKP